MAEPSPLSWRVRAQKLFTAAINFLLPPVCVSCHRLGTVWCDDCYGQIAWLEEPLCDYCGQALPHAGGACPTADQREWPLAQLRAAALYSGPLRAAIHALKYEGMFALAGPLAGLLTERWPRWTEPVDLILPIPLHSKRERERGYNQAALIVEHLSRQVRVGSVRGALWRVRPTRPQVGLSWRERVENVQRAFQADPEQVTGKHILLVDDVCTTGATLAAAADALLAARAGRVSAFCVARALHSTNREETV